MKKRPLLLPAVLAVALWIAGLVVFNAFSDKIPHNPTDAQLLTWIQGNQNSITLGCWLWMLGSLSFLWFAALLRPRLAEAEGGSRTYTALAFAGAAAATVFGILMQAGDLTAAINQDNISASTAATLHNLSDMFFVGGEIALIPFFAGVAVVAFRTGLLPKWWAAFSVLIAVVLVIGPIGWAALIFGTPVWLLGTGLIVGSTPRARQRAAVAATVYEQFGGRGLPPPAVRRQRARRPDIIANTATTSATIRSSQSKLLTATPPPTARMISSRTTIQSRGIRFLLSSRRRTEIAAIRLRPLLDELAEPRQVAVHPSAVEPHRRADSLGLPVGLIAHVHADAAAFRAFRLEGDDAARALPVDRLPRDPPILLLLDDLRVPFGVAPCDSRLPVQQ